MLRKACQEIINNSNIGDYHARIDAHSKTLIIVGPCGKTLFNIYGIKFGKVIPSMSEIDVAVELLQEFFLSHKDKIANYFAAKKDLKKIKEFDKPDHIRFETSNDNLVKVITGEESDTNYNTDPESLIYSYPSNTFSYQQGLYKELPECGKLLKDKKLHAEMRICAKLEFNNNILKTAFTNAKSAIAACDI